VILENEARKLIWLAKLLELECHVLGIFILYTLRMPNFKILSMQDPKLLKVSLDFFFDEIRLTKLSFP
jgi:hypothetical protein